MNKVFAVTIDIYDMEWGYTHCECCGPDPYYEFQGCVIDSLHLTKESAEAAARKIVIEEELRGIECDSAHVTVFGMEVEQ